MPLHKTCLITFNLAQCGKVKLVFITFSAVSVSLPVQVNMTPRVYFPRGLLVSVLPWGPRPAHLLSLPPISPAARRTVSSTIKGCAIMKGALAEAIYFAAQCRKVSLVLIFQRRLCVPYYAIIRAMRRMHPA